MRPKASSLPLTDEQIRVMCADPWRWADRLREEAKRRKLGDFASITPINDIVAALRAAIK